MPGDDVAQCQSALDLIGKALTEAGSDFEHAVRARYILPDRRDLEPCWPLLRATIGASAAVATMIECNLIEPKYQFEIEVTAVMPPQ